ncbi:MAG: LysM peptidoglycan-binding domain-containing protein [Anaerolineae bacterium]|nr:LysM peptidoglycan-binding domain-containing protein [Anaerolineae bacterium]
MHHTVSKATAVIATLICLLMSVTAVTAAPLPQSVPCVEDYTVQAGDWLSTIAEKYYGDVQAYTVIVNATNAAAQESDKYAPITDPSIIEVSQTLCIPLGETAEGMINGEIETPPPAPVNPEDKLLAIIGNRSFEDIPSTLKLVGGEFGEGQEFSIEAGQEIRLEIEPGEYDAYWSSPEGVTFSRDFLAKAGVVAINWFVPEESYVVTEIQRIPFEEDEDRADALGQFTTPSVMHNRTPYRAPEGKELLVAGNRSFADLPSTLTLTGGQFGGGKEFTINPGQELIVALDPVEYTVTWSSPPAESGIALSRGGTITPVPGEVTVVWVVPEENRAFLQKPGQPGQALR